ncbi:MAG: DJ-1/PfpI/YhbO family deglycase/protease [Candidatus Eisenbacteria bacterium]|nr:DJ-1/PfpI/YhbO family deglycase/protease [Candidatus Latescibacterota bacterium]MBD3301702.1 DJ-1/PfpI/YhbO family deglycase/protease [Candidatus Eisenbacteria bacterium]
MRLKGKKIAFFVAPLYEDLELHYPLIRMQEEGADPVVIGPERTKYEGKKGIPIEASRAITEVSPDAFDGLVIPGGYAPDHMRRSSEMIEFVRWMHEAGRPIAAICHAGWMLASAGILEGRTVTGFFSIKDDLVHAGAAFVDREVVRDANLITSRNPGDLPAFCRTIIEAVAGS